MSYRGHGTDGALVPDDLHFAWQAPLIQGRIWHACKIRLTIPVPFCVVDTALQYFHHFMLRILLCRRLSS